MPRPFIAVLALTAAAAQAQAPAPDRGRLLYETHCIACHSTQMHWRAKRVAHDWDSLRAQVTNWQARERLDWSDADIDAVARHLNDTIYHFPRAQARTPPAPLDAGPTALDASRG